MQLVYFATSLSMIDTMLLHSSRRGYCWLALTEPLPHRRRRTSRLRSLERLQDARFDPSGQSSLAEQAGTGKTIQGGKGETEGPKGDGPGAKPQGESLPSCILSVLLLIDK